MVSKIYRFSSEQGKTAISYDLIVTLTGEGKSKNNISRNKPVNNDAPVKTFQDFLFVEQNLKSARGTIYIYIRIEQNKNCTTRTFPSRNNWTINEEIAADLWRLAQFLARSISIRCNDSRNDFREPRTIFSRSNAIFLSFSAWLQVVTRTLFDS